MRKRSKYKPKGVRLDNVAWLLSGMKPMRTEPAALDLRIKNHAAMTAMVKGEGTRHDIDVLIGAFNMAEALARIGRGTELMPEIRAGQDALLEMSRRGLAKGKFLFTGPELNAANLAMDIHDAQLDAATISDIEKGLEVVTQEIKARRARVIEQKKTACA